MQPRVRPGVGSPYDGDDPARDTPRPDPDPLDGRSDGHGTSVAGIAAGQGVLRDGSPYTGPYSSELDFSGFAIAPGVAPRVQLYALKVFGFSSTTGVLADALEWAADPNEDFDFSDRLDVVHMSIGGAFGYTGPGNPDQEAVNRLCELGCTVAISAGNSKNTIYIIAEPGTAERAITVANSIDDGVQFGAIAILAPAVAAGFYAAVEGTMTRPLDDVGEVEAEVAFVDPPDAGGILLNGTALAGRIALVDRGTCFFSDKIREVQAAGSTGIIVINNDSGPPFAMGGDATGITIPGVMISLQDGQLLKDQLGSGVRARLGSSVVIARPELADQLVPGSS